MTKADNFTYYPATGTAPAKLVLHDGNVNYTISPYTGPPPVTKADIDKLRTDVLAAIQAGGTSQGSLTPDPVTNTGGTGSGGVTPTPGSTGGTGTGGVTPTTGSTGGGLTPSPSTGGTDTVVLYLSGDAYNGNPTVSIWIDGLQVATDHEVKVIRAKPRTYDGNSEQMTFQVPGKASHTIGVQLTNDLYEGFAYKDRNAYLDGATVNGEVFNVTLNLAGPQRDGVTITKGQGTPPSGGTGGTGGTGGSTSGSGSSGSVSSGGTGGTTASGGGISPTATTVVNVGPGRPVKELADGLAAAQQSGAGKVLVDDGRYTTPKSFSVPGLIIQSTSGNPRNCVIDGRGGFGADGKYRLAEGKGFLIPQAPCTIQGFAFVNCGSPQSGGGYTNEAAIWTEMSDAPGTILIKGNAFDGNANGVFCPGDLPGVKIVLDGNVWGFKSPNGLNASANGTGIGSAHDAYIQCDEVEVLNNYFYGACNGHNIHSRCKLTNMHDNPCTAADGGRVLDVSDGGVMHFDRNVVFTRMDESGRTIPPGLIGGAFGNANVIAYASESTRWGTPGGTINGNFFFLTHSGSTIWIGAGIVTASGNKVVVAGQGSLQVTGDTLSGLSAGDAVSGSIPAMPAPPF